ncbi:hypothetical protein ACFCP7_06655 [Paenibacillus elgii]
MNDRRQNEQQPHTMWLARLLASFRGRHVLSDKESMANAGAFDTMERKYSQARHKKMEGLYSSRYSISLQ